MKIFRLDPTEGYEWINCLLPEGYDTLERLDEDDRADWQPVAVRRVAANLNARAKASDFPWFGRNAMIVRRRAFDVLSVLLRDCGQFLPLLDEGGVDVWVHNTHVVHALDRARSEVRYVPSTNRVMQLRRPSFIRDAIVGRAAFRLPREDGGATFVDERFVELVKSADLRGLDLTLAWESVAD